MGSHGLVPSYEFQFHVLPPLPIVMYLPQSPPPTSRSIECCRKQLMNSYTGSPHQWLTK